VRAWAARPADLALGVMAQRLMMAEVKDQESNVDIGTMLQRLAKVPDAQVASLAVALVPLYKGTVISFRRDSTIAEVKLASAACCRGRAAVVRTPPSRTPAVVLHLGPCWHPQTMHQRLTM
jgi:hypothetical protein